MKFIMCPNYSKGCVWAVAQLFDEGTIDIVRKKQRFTITGKDFNIRGTCPYCFDHATMIVRDNKIQEDDLTILEKENYYEEVAKAKAEREARNNPTADPDDNDSTSGVPDPDSTDNGSGLTGNENDNQQPTDQGGGSTTRTYTAKPTAK